MTTHDVAIALAILHACTLDMNPDGTLPTARVKALWDALVSEGEVERSFNARRWKVIRGIIDRVEGIEWQDSSYLPGFYACKWRLADWIMVEIEALQGRTQGNPGGPSLISQHTHTSLVSGWLVRKPEEEVIVPENALMVRRRLPDAEEVDGYLQKAA